MWILRASVVCSLVLNSRASWTHDENSSDLEEGRECHREGDQVWVCKKDTECEGLKDILQLNGRLRTCSWTGLRTHVICCPSPVPSNRQTVSKSEQKCMEYQTALCSDENDLNSFEPIYSSSPDFKDVEDERTLHRKKRQETPVSNIPTLNIHYVMGGRETKPAEFPSVEMGAREDFHIEVSGGTRAAPRQHPHTALVGYGEADAISWECGGSLISETFVLSAAHCVNTPYGLARWVRLGDLDLKSDTEEARPQQFEVIERVVHPGYRAPAFYNDLALLRLDRAAVFDRYVRPACLHSDHGDLRGFGTAAGWGRNETHGPRSSSLMQVNIKFVPTEQCRSLVGVISNYLKKGVDGDTMICAGEPGKDTCQGDSGGPLVLPSSAENGQCLSRLVGLTSFGPRNCGQTSVPGAYVRVAHFLSWIESIVWPV